MVFAGTTSVLLWRVFTIRGPVVTITPEGIRDVRVLAELIPWNAINDIAIWDRREMVPAVDPAAEAAHSDTSRSLDGARLVRRRTTAIGSPMLNEPPLIDANHSVRATKGCVAGANGTLERKKGRLAWTALLAPAAGTYLSAEPATSRATAEPAGR
jgi:hypothetical protein